MDHVASPLQFSAAFFLDVKIKSCITINHVFIHTWTEMETGVTGCVSLTGQNPTLGTLTRAAESQIRDTGKLEVTNTQVI